MKKHDFILWLRNRLSDLPPAELDRVCGFYANAIDERMEDGIAEEAAVHAMGEPEALLREIRATLPEQYHIEPGFDADPQEGVYARRLGEPGQAAPAASPRRRGKAALLIILAAVILTLVLAAPVVLYTHRTISRSHTYVEYYDQAPNVDMPAAADFTPLPDPSEVDRIVIRIDVGTLQLSTSTVANVSCSDNTKFSFGKETDGNGFTTLTLDAAFKDDIFSDENSLDVALPYGNYELVIESDAGSVYADGLIARRIDISVHAGTVQLNCLNVKDSLSAAVNTGYIWAYDIGVPKTGSISLSCDIGDITCCLPGDPADYTFNTSVALGEMDAPFTGGSGDIAVDLSVNIGNLSLSFDQE
ncbi:MAG: hypothetical protein IK141_05600 [Clostridia bacterium]|nr:hypothetical protein [Clostridia bacterium]